MPRIRVRRDPCDCDDCADDRMQFVDPSLRSALARLEPPPKSAILIIDGALNATPNPSSSGSTSLQMAQCPHLDTVARDGCCGFLAACSGDSSPDLATQILRGRRGQAQPLPKRFKDVQVAYLGNTLEPQDLVESLGCYVAHSYSPGPVQEWPQPQDVAKTITALLGKLTNYVIN